VFASVAVVAGESTASGLELPSTPTLPSALQTPSVPTLATAPTLPSAPQPSTPTLPAAPALLSSPQTPSAPTLPKASTLSNSSSTPVAAPDFRGTSAAVSPTGTVPLQTSGGFQFHGSTGSHSGGARAASRQHGRRDGGKRKKSRSASTRRLRRVLARLHGCFYVLSQRERRVLAFRAGLNRRHALSRREVAKRLQISRKRVGRIERRALHRLRAAARSDGCAAGARNRPEALAGVSRFVSAAGIVGQPAALTVSPFRSSTPSPEASFQPPLRGEFANSPSPSQPSHSVGRDPAGAAAIWALAILLIIAMIEVRAFLKLRRQK
jgi:DNA-binding CsgD family transcriptional regulator